MSSPTHEQPWWSFFNAMARNSQLTDSQHRVLIALLSYANGPTTSPVLGHSRPGVARLVQDTGYSRSTVLRALKALTVSGWITVTTPGGHQHGHGRATTYQLQIPDTPAVDDMMKGVTSEALEAHKGVSSGTHRESLVTRKGPAGDTPPTQDRLNTSPPHFRSHRDSVDPSDLGPKTKWGMASASLNPQLQQVLSSYGIPAMHHQAVLEAAAADPTTSNPTARLHASENYAAQCLARVKADRAKAIDTLPRCEDHEGNPASRCSGCWADIKAGHRSVEYLGKRLPTVRYDHS